MEISFILAHLVCVCMHVYVFVEWPD